MYALFFFLGFWVGGMFVMVGNYSASKIMGVEIEGSITKFVLLWPYTVVRGLMILAGK